ncbi:flavin monoamine oxidase family protein [Streptomyces albidoflavus]|uniref:flavin monoamine oxidase family protein n=1 Tax=Streptomyces albidoflavus TaxID=1886 RepID=UPI00315C822F
MTSTVPPAGRPAAGLPPITMVGPDFPFPYDDYLGHAAGLGQIPATAHGTEVAVIGGGLSGIVTAYELMKMGLKPVVYEADQIGGRLRTVGFDGCAPGLRAEMGAMRFPPSSTSLQHYIDLVGLQTRPFPNPLSPATPSTVVDLKGESHYARTLDDLPQVYRDVADAWQRCLDEGADHGPRVNASTSPSRTTLGARRGLGQIPATAHGTEVAVIGGGLSGIVTAYELMKMGLKPVVYEADQIGGRLRTVGFDGCAPGLRAEMGAMRFPPSSTSLQHYIDLVGLQTRPFPNPLSPATPSTGRPEGGEPLPLPPTLDLKGESHYARTLDDLPQVYRDVADAWQRCLDEGAEFGDMNEALRTRDIPRIREIWARLVERLDDQTFYGFLAGSEAFRSFKHREIFGQVGFGTGGWDTDFPNSILEILRVVYTEADDHHRGIVGGSQQLPLRLWERAPGKLVHWTQGTSLASLHEDGAPRGAVTRLHRTAGGGITVTDASGAIRTYPAAVFTGQSWLLLSKIACDETLFPMDHWTAMERTHYMESSKLFVPVDRPFWLDKDPATGRDRMSMTLTDRMTRGTYLLDDGPDKPAVICLSYTWCDDSLKWLPLSPAERMEVMLASLGEIYPDVDIRRHIIGSPVTVSWENEPWFMGAFKANLPGHYRYQRRLFTHFMQDGLPADRRGIFLAGDDISWTAGWAEGAVQTALNAVWGVMHHFGGTTDPTNPGPGDRFDELAPVELPED